MDDQQDEPVNDPLANARAYESALRAMDYMQSSQFGSHAEGRLAGKPEDASAPRRSRLEQVIDGAVQKIIGGVGREIRSMGPQLPTLYRGDPMEYMRIPAGSPPPETQLPESEMPESRQAVGFVSPEGPVFAAGANPQRAMPDPVEAPENARSRQRSDDPKWPQTETPQRPRFQAPLPPDGVMRPASVDESKIPDRPMSGMLAGSGAIEPPRISAEEAGLEPRQPMDVETRSGYAPDRFSEAEFDAPNFEQITGREQMMQGADVVSDFAMTTSLFAEMVYENIRGLNEKVNQVVIALDRLTEDSDQ